jgi:hypothetical protein
MDVLQAVFESAQSNWITLVNVLASFVLGYYMGRYTAPKTVHKMAFDRERKDARESRVVSLGNTFMNRVSEVICAALRALRPEIVWAGVVTIFILGASLVLVFLIYCIYSAPATQLTPEQIEAEIWIDKVMTINRVIDTSQDQNEKDIILEMIRSEKKVKDSGLTGE